MDKVIQVRVAPKAQKDDIIKFGNGYKVYISAPPAEGKANKRLIEIMAKYFNLKKSQVNIISGKKSKDKLVRIQEG